MSKTTKTSAAKKSPAPRKTEMEPQGKVRISPAVQELGTTAMLLYEKMSSLTLPQETLATLGEMVRTIDKTRLEIEILESDYDTSLNTIASLRDTYRARKTASRIPQQELDRLNALPESLNRAIEEQAAFQRNMDELQTECDEATARLAKTADALQEAQCERGKLAKELHAVQKELEAARSEAEHTRGDADALREMLDKAQEQAERAGDLENELAGSREEMRALSVEKQGGDAEKDRLGQELADARGKLQEALGQTADIETREKEVRNGLREEQEKLSAALGELEDGRKQAQEAQSTLSSDLNALQTEKDSLLCDLNDVRAKAVEATSRAENVDSELSKLKDTFGTTASENEQLRSALEQERSSRRTEAENTKALSEQNSRLGVEREQMDEDRRKAAQQASETARTLDEMSGRLSTMEKKNADLTSAMEHIKAKENGAARELQMAESRRELAEERERGLSEQRSKDETRIRTLERRLNELLVQRAEMEKEMEVTRSAMKRVEENVNALCAVKRRIRSGSGR